MLHNQKIIANFATYLFWLSNFNDLNSYTRRNNGQNKKKLMVV